MKNSQKKKKRSDFLQNFGGNSPTDGTRQTGFTVAALNKKTFYTADHFYEKVQRNGTGEELVLEAERKTDDSRLGSFPIP